MGLFDAFTGAPAVNAANQNKGILQFVDDRGRNDITSASDLAANYLNSGYGNARNDITTGAGNALGYISPLARNYSAATNLGIDALGVNGQAGTDAARAAFTASPSYEWNLNQGLDAINRRRAAGGMLNSGNADRDAQLFGAGLASNEYGNWISRLLGFTNPALAANQSASQISGRQGELLSGLDTGGATALANTYTNAANARTGLDTNLVGPYTNQNTNAANAELNGSKNIWGLGLAAAQTAAGIPGIGSLFGSGSGNANYGIGGWGGAPAGYDKNGNWITSNWS